MCARSVQLRLNERDAGGGSKDAPLMTLATHNADSAAACLALAEFAFGTRLELAVLGN
jgi:hypothetical protein